jgi:hypothetical protein
MEQKKQEFASLHIQVTNFLKSSAQRAMLTDYVITHVEASL